MKTFIIPRYLVVFSICTATFFSGCRPQGGTGAEAADVDVSETPAKVASPAVQSPAAKGTAIKGKVVETMNSGGYTYALIQTGEQKTWTAGPMTKLAIGDTVEASRGMLMSKFRSTSLDRTFDAIYFVPAFVGGSRSAGPMPAGHPNIGGAPSAGMPGGHPSMGGGGAAGDGQPIEIDPEKIAKAKRGKRVAEIYAEKDKLAGQSVAVRGVVVKFTPNIMSRNWIHLKDGTGSKPSDDLTITTDEKVKVGDTVLVRGVVAADKDFGYGYKYSVIIENAKVTVE